MNASRTLVSLMLAGLPLVVSAQTTNAPGGQAATGTPIEQQPGKGSPSGSTATTPDVNNPSGSLSVGKTPRSSGDTSMSNKSSSSTKPMKRNDKSNTTEPGDAPTYPAPARDGTPTK